MGVHSKMTASAKKGRHSGGSRASNNRLEDIVTRLEQDEIELGAPLLDAAIAGVVLSVNPCNSQMRESAGKSWRAIKALLAKHLLSEQRTAIPLAQHHAACSRTTAGQLKRRHSQLRGLAQRVDAVCFEQGGEAEVALAAKALCKLAVRLDDLIDGAEHDLIVRLRQCAVASRLDHRHEGLANA